MPRLTRQEADAYDRMLDAAFELADLITSGGFEIDEDVLEELAVYLAGSAQALRGILKNVKLTR